MSAALTLSSSNWMQNSNRTETYLKHCIDELDPKAAVSYERRSTLWKVAAVATALFLTAATIGAIGGLILPLYSPFHLITVALLAFLPFGLVQILSRFLDNLSLNKEMARELKGLRREYEAISSISVEEIRELLRVNGIHWEHIPRMRENPGELVHLKPLLAKLNRLKLKVETYRSLASTHHGKLLLSMHTNKRKAELHNKLLSDFHWSHMKAKVELALLLRALQYPQSTLPPKHVYSFIDKSPPQGCFFQRHSETPCIRLQSGRAISNGAIYGTTPIDLSREFPG